MPASSSSPVFAPEMFCPCVGLAEHRNVYLDKKSGIRRVTLILFYHLSSSAVLNIIIVIRNVILFNFLGEFLRTADVAPDDGDGDLDQK